MKKLVLLLAYMAFLFQCSNDVNKSEQVKNQPLKHHEAADRFYLQRSWPEGKLDLRAYDLAIRSAQEQMLLKNELPGFDKAWVERGPANIGARINTIAVHPNNNQIIYVGFAVGGVFKTTNGGQNWDPVFDYNPYLAIGDIVLDPNDSETVYVGTGDPNISGYPFLGDGIYRSEDAGNTWTHLGLEDERIVSEIIVDPENSHIIYASCMGLPFERNPQRGLYKSSDYGQSWEQILFAGEQAGIIDIAMDPFSNEILYAASWDRIRNNQESVVNGPNAKIYKSTNAGDTWTELSGGLPTENMGRIGLAVSPTQPNVIYAEYVNTSSQLDNIYKSTNGGQSWTPIINWEDEELGLSEGALGGFGWYFGKIRLNPYNPDEIYILGITLWKTEDGGDHWLEAAPPWWEYNVHADKHDLVFIGQDSFLLATDGGMYLATDQQTTWQDVESIAATQFYRVAYNPHKPDHYYGGAQDNGSTGGTAIDEEWARIWGGDGFQMQFHPLDSNIVFAESQRGNIVVTVDGLSSGIWDSGTYGISDEDRTHWDTPYILSPQDPDVMYTGTYRVYKSETGGVPYWEPISEGLTDSVTFGNSFHTISTIDQSPMEEGLIYVGTTDGNVKRTDNDGDLWVDITDGLPERYITSVKASPELTNGVYVTVSGYKYNDFDPHIFKSDDRGETWYDIAGDLPNLAINDVYVLPGFQDSVIFVGTDGGVFGTINSGEHWHRLGNNMPIIPIYDLEFNVARNELVAGTHARSIMSYNLDSILVVPEVINQIEEIIEKELTVYPSPAKDRINLENSFSGPVHITLSDVNGKMVMEITDWINQEIEVDHLTAGLYFIQVRQGKQLWYGKFVKN
ncbi:MAG: T9SS C-terminal target domain-containing protein [Bacteroidetes bacterium]|nr:MAG: T9SS C-terminal target domain-containing protein [Bacteroidota bacterium]